MKKLSFFCLIALILNGCVSSKIVSQINPAFKNKVIKKICVFVNTKDMEIKQSTEKTYADKILLSCGTKAIPSYSLFFSGQEYNSEEIEKTLNENNVDTVLELFMTDAYVSTVQLDDTETTTGNIKNYGNKWNYNQTTTINHGGTIEKPRGVFTVNLIDVKTGIIAWTGQVKSKGHASSSWKDLFNSTLDTTIDKLVDDGFLSFKQGNDSY